MTAAAIDRLISATKGRRADLLEEFLSTEAGFDVEQQFDGCFNSLHYAAGRKFRTSEDANDWLGYFCLEEAIPVHAIDGFDCCALHHACVWGNIISVEWLIRHNADVNQRNDIGETPFISACGSSIDRIPKLKLLESHHADIFTIDNFGSTALHTAAACKCTFPDEEAHKILSYLVTEKGISVNTAAYDDDTPLKAAFKDGSFFNVKWLLKHGAEKPGEEELIAAAQSRTSEHETDGLLSFLIRDEGLDVNTVLNHIGETPLSFACSDGSFWAMKWLIENGAHVGNKEDTTMKTLVMRACDGGIDVFDKLLYLTDKGLDVKTKNFYKGQTALFFAVSNIHKQYRTTLEYLVKEKGLSLNDDDQRSNTPFLRACSTSLSLSLLNFLIDLGADVTAINCYNENALHLLAKGSRMSNLISSSVIELLIEKGVDITQEDIFGRRPHERALGEDRMLFRRYYDSVNVSVLGEKVQLDSCKICVVGKEMAGKTTFVNSLLDLNLPPVDPDDRTAGVVVRTDVIRGVGKVSIWDFGAQPTFHSAHGLFFGPSNTIFVLVLCYCKDGKIVPEAVLLRRGLYWLGFAKAARRPILSDEEARPHVVVLGNVIGKGDDNVEASFQLKRIVANLQKEFADTFEISGVFELDCSKSKSNGMTACRAYLKELRLKVLKNAAGVPKLCRDIEENICVPMRQRDDRLACFVNAADFSSWIKERFRLTLTDAVMRVIFDYLDSSGIIIDLGQRKCLEPPLLCQNVIGPLLSPPYFPISVQANDAGIANKEDVASALEAFRNDLKRRRISSEFSVTVDEAIEVLVYLQLYIPIEPGVYQVPTLIRKPKPADAWSSAPEMNVYRGQRYQCTRLVDIISPSSFVILQFRCFQMASICYEAWKDGMKLVKIVDDKAIECLIEFGVKEYCCIDVVLRWSNQSACEKLAEELLKELKMMIASVCDERSPGVPLDWCYFDSKHLERLDEDPAIYSASDVESKKDPNRFVISIMPKGRRRCRVRDLVVVVEEIGHQVPSAAAATPCTVTPSEDAFPANDEVASDDLLRACAAAAGSKWESIGGLLIDLDELDEIAESTRDKKTRLLKVLKAWKNASRSSPTVGKLLKWFLEVDIAERVIKGKYIDLFG